MSKIKCNYHTHTKYCDGKNTPDDMVQRAIELGFTHLGFSEHSSCSITNAERLDYDAYFNEVFALREKYKDKIEILVGIEQDTYATKFDPRTEYIIGSMHHLSEEYDYMAIDHSKENTEKNVEKFFGGDYYKYAKVYYEQESEVVKKTNATFIGHFDLVTKYNEGYAYFSEEDDRYLKCAYECMDYLLEYNIPFEMNTGAIARGYRTTPYMNPLLLKHLCENKGEIVISSDCHNKDYLDCEFDTCVEMAIKAGFKYTNILTRQGWKSIALDTLK